MTTNPLFTTVIPVHNRPKLIREALNSVLSQQSVDQQVIVVDDGSTDDTPGVLSEYSDRITVLRQANRGPGAARNVALQHADGQYIAFLDSDDLWMPWTLATYRQVIQQHHRPAFIASREWSFSGDEVPSSSLKAPLRATAYDDYYASYSDGDWVPLCGAAVRADVLRDVGGFNENPINFEETDLWMRLGTTDGFVRIEEPFCSARREHEGNVTHDLARCVKGVLNLIEQEDAGAYPGGAPRRAQRVAMLTRHVRPISIQCLRNQHIADAWALYRKSFGWHMRLGRVRYLLGFLGLTLASASRSRRQT